LEVAGVAAAKAPALAPTKSTPPQTPASTLSSASFASFSTAATQPNTGSTPEAPGKKLWAAGTGFGHDSAKSGQFDPLAYRAAKERKAKQMDNIAFEVLHSLTAATAPEAGPDAPPMEELAEIIEKSALIPFMEGYLSTDSMLEMEQAAKLYTTVLQLVDVFATAPSLHRLLLPLPHQAHSLMALLQARKRQHATLLAALAKVDEHAGIAATSATARASGTGAKFAAGSGGGGGGGGSMLQPSYVLPASKGGGKVKVPSGAAGAVAAKLVRTSFCCRQQIIAPPRLTRLLAEHHPNPN
jgi:hypothetical protein